MLPLVRLVDAVAAEKASTPADAVEAVKEDAVLAPVPVLVPAPMPVPLPVAVPAPVFVVVPVLVPELMLVAVPVPLNEVLATLCVLTAPLLNNDVATTVDAGLDAGKVCEAVVFAADSVELELPDPSEHPLNAAPMRRVAEIKSALTCFDCTTVIPVAYVARI